MSNCQCGIEITEKSQRKTLIILLLINFLMFCVEIVGGLIAQSSGLIADAMDMLADALIYLVALYAIGHSIAAKQRGAWLSGLFQILLGLAVAGDVLRRSLMGSEPESSLMIVLSAVALVANLVCVILIAKHRHEEVHMRASWIFSKSDLLANLGVMISGGLVMWLGKAWPDLLIGGLISLLVMNGGRSILKDVRQERLRSDTAGKE